MNAKEAMERIKVTPVILHEDEAKWVYAKGFLEAVEKFKPVIKALEYCGVDPSTLAPENNRQFLVATMALGQYRRDVMGEE